MSYLVSQTFVIEAWSGHRCREPAIQLQQAMWSVGATVSPFIIRQFLVELETNDERFQTNSSIVSMLNVSKQLANYQLQPMLETVYTNYFKLLL